METEVAVLNPFPGLRAFEEEEDILFFGREKQIDELLRKLRTSRFLAIIGSSGSGKSSLVKSGLLPSLHSGLMSGVGSQWRIALFRPGNDPIGQLNLALSKNGVLRDIQSPEDQETNSAINESILRRSNLGLIETYKQSGLDKRNNLLVLVDQFEEIFRFSKYEKETGEGKRDSIAFINLLLKAAEQKEFPIYVVFTMRSDFLGDCTEFRGLPEAINEGQYLVPRMTRDERREAITGPIAVGNGSITPALVNRLLNDVGDNPDQLPILQHAMMRTWNEWKAKGHPEEPIDIEDYEAIGTISEALSQHAEEAYAELRSDRERLICEIIFKELTDKGGLASGIRRPRLLSELCAATGATPEEVKAVIEVFRKPGRGFLMPAYPIPLTEKSIIDISHESIMRVWKRLITWLEEEEEAAQVYLHLCEAVNLYESGKGSLLRDPELQIALKWKDEQNKNAAWASRYNDYYDKVIFFLEHSRQKRDLELQHKEELAKQRLRNSRRLSIAIGVVALLALLSGIWFFELKVEANNAEKRAIEQKKEADKQRQQAETNRLAAVSSQKQAEAAKDSATVSKDKAIAEEKIALHKDSIAQSETRKAKYAESVALAAEDSAKNSAQRATESERKALKSEREATDAKIQAYKDKVATEKLQKREQSKNDAHRAKMYMNDTDYRNCLRLSLEAYNKNQDNEGDFQDDDIYSALYISWKYAVNDKNQSALESPVRSLANMPNANVVFAGDESGKIVTLHEKQGVLELSESKSNAMAPPDIRSLAIDPSGAYLLAVSLNTATVFSISRDYTLQKFAQVRFTGNGRHGAFLGSNYFLVQSTDGITRFELAKQPIAKDTLKLPHCSSLAVTHGGKVFVAADKVIFEYANWDSKTPASIFTLSSAVTSLAIDKSGRYLAAGTYNGAIWLKDINSTEQGTPYYGIHKSAINDLKFSTVMDGRLQLASASSDKTVKLMEVKPGQMLNTKDLITIAPDHTNWVYSLAYSPDGRYLFSGAEDQNVIVRPTTMKYLYDALTTNK